MSRLEQAEIAYMLTGSLALALYAEPRMTRDIGVVIECDEERAATLVALFEDDSDADVDAAHCAARDKGMFSVIHLESLVKADFIVKPTTPYETIKFNQRRARRSGRLRRDRHQSGGSHPVQAARGAQ